MKKNKNVISEKKPIRLFSHERYRFLLECLYDFRYLTAYHISTLVYIDMEKKKLKQGTPHMPLKKTLVNIKGIQKNLTSLYKHGLVQKTAIVSSSYLQLGSYPDLWSLTDEGKTMLAILKGTFLENNVPSINTSKAHKGLPADQYFQFLHRMAVADVLIQFQVFISQAQDFRMLYLSTDREIVFNLNNKGKQRVLYPDGCFILKYVPKSTPIHFFLEIDRGTETLQVLEKKAEAYINILNNQAVYKQTLLPIYKTANFFSFGRESDVLLSEWFYRFRVLFICRTHDRLIHIVERFKRVFGELGGLFSCTTLEHFSCYERETKISSNKKEYTNVRITPEKAKVLDTKIWYSCDRSQQKAIPQGLFS